MEKNEQLDKIESLKNVPEKKCKLCLRNEFIFYFICFLLLALHFDVSLGKVVWS